MRLWLVTWSTLDEFALQFVVGRGKLRQRLRYSASGRRKFVVLRPCLDQRFEVNHLLAQGL
jgi:hypothetical protein